MKQVIVALILVASAYGQIFSSGGQSSNLSSIGGTGIVTGGVAGSQGVGGLAAAGSTTNLGNPVMVGGMNSTAIQPFQLDASNYLKVNLAAESGTVTVQPGNTANTTPWLVGGAVTQSGTWTVQPGNTANTTAWLFNLGSVGGAAAAIGKAGVLEVTTWPLTACNTAGAVDSGAAYLPTTSSAVTNFTASACIDSVYLNNTDSVSHTVTITDGSSSCNSAACPYLGPSFVLPALSAQLIPFKGMKFNTGVKWYVVDATANKVLGQVFGYQ
jgi:hypothetical protein